MSFNLPDEVILKIFSESSSRDLKSLAQVSTLFKRIAADPSLKNRHKVGNVCLLIRQLESNESKPFWASYATHILYSTRNGNTIKDTVMYLSKNTAEEMEKIIASNTSILIKKLNLMGETASINANALQEALIEENKDYYIAKLSYK